MELHELFAQDPNFSWLPADAQETLGDCFETKLETIPAGECRANEGRIGYLFRGSGRVKRADGTEHEAAAGSLFGIRAGGPQHHQRSEDILTATEDCTVYWIGYDVLEFGCYRGCWFHIRFNMTLQALLEKGL